MQRIYSITFYSALAASVGLVSFLVLTLVWPIVVDIRHYLLLAMGLLLLFVILNLAFLAFNEKNTLRPPQFVSEKSASQGFMVVWILFFLITICGFCSFPDGPIEPNHGSFTGKGGRKYTYQQFRKFKNWERVYVTAFAITAFFPIVLLPFYDSRTKKWIIEDKSTGRGN